MQESPARHAFISFTEVEAILNQLYGSHTKQTFNLLDGLLAVPDGTTSALLRQSQDVCPDAKTIHKFLRLGRVINLMSKLWIATFRTGAELRSWLGKPIPVLDNRRPVDCLNSDDELYMFLGLIDEVETNNISF